MGYKRLEVGGNWGEIFQHADWHPKRSTCPVLTPFDNPEIGYHAKLVKPGISPEAENRDYGDYCSGEIIPKASFCGIARLTPSLPREGEAACGGKPPQTPFIAIFTHKILCLVHAPQRLGSTRPRPVFYFPVLGYPGTSPPGYEKSGSLFVCVCVCVC